MGGVISGDRAAYRYLSDTVDSYRTPEELAEMVRQAGWSDVSSISLAMGTVGIVTGGAQLVPKDVRTGGRPLSGQG